MFGGGLDFGQIQKQFRDMQKKLAELEKELAERIVEATAGGGMVKVKVNGIQEVVQVEIDPEVIDGDDKAMLEDLILAAVNEGVKKSKALREKETAKVTGMGMGGLGGLLGM
jgi:DNA-binding YbaB/EbfC family protein